MGPHRQAVCQFWQLPRSLPKLDWRLVTANMLSDSADQIPLCRMHCITDYSHICLDLNLNLSGSSSSMR